MINKQGSKMSLAWLPKQLTHYQNDSPTTKMTHPLPKQLTHYQNDSPTTKTTHPQPKQLTHNQNNSPKFSMIFSCSIPDLWTKQPTHYQNNPPTTKTTHLLPKRLTHDQNNSPKFSMIFSCSIPDLWTPWTAFCNAMIKFDNEHLELHFVMPWSNLTMNTLNCIL